MGIRCIDCVHCDIVKKKCYPESKDCEHEYDLTIDDIYKFKAKHCDFYERISLEEIGNVLGILFSELAMAFRELGAALNVFNLEENVERLRERYRFKRSSESVRRNKDLRGHYRNYIPIINKKLPYVRRCF